MVAAKNRVAFAAFSGKTGVRTGFYPILTRYIMT
jgi:hypothetical protein